MPSAWTETQMLSWARPWAYSFELFSSSLWVSCPFWAWNHHQMPDHSWKLLGWFWPTQQAGQSPWSQQPLHHSLDQVDWHQYVFPHRSPHRRQWCLDICGGSVFHSGCMWYTQRNTHILFTSKGLRPYLGTFGRYIKLVQLASRLSRNSASNFNDPAVLQVVNPADDIEFP